MNQFALCMSQWKFRAKEECLKWPEIIDKKKRLNKSEESRKKSKLLWIRFALERCQGME